MEDEHQDRQLHKEMLEEQQQEMHSLVVMHLDLHFQEIEAQQDLEQQ